MKRNHDGAGAVYVQTNTQGLLAQSMAKELPEVEYSTNLRKEHDAGILSLNNKKLKAKPAFAGKNFLDVFSYELIAGNSNTALADVSGILLYDQTALKLFNTTNVIGKTVRWEMKDDEAVLQMYIKLRAYLKRRLPIPLTSLTYSSHLNYMHKKMPGVWVM